MWLYAGGTGIVYILLDYIICNTTSVITVYICPGAQHHTGVYYYFIHPITRIHVPFRVVTCLRRGVNTPKRIIWNTCIVLGNCRHAFPVAV